MAYKKATKSSKDPLFLIYNQYWDKDRPTGGRNKDGWFTSGHAFHVRGTEAEAKLEASKHLASMRLGVRSKGWVLLEGMPKDTSRVMIRKVIEYEDSFLS